MSASKPLLDRKTYNLLKSYYYNMKNPGAFSGAGALLRALQKAGHKTLKLSQIKEFLQSQTPHTIHRLAPKTFQRRKIISKGINELMQIDLADLSKLQSKNNHMRWILAAVDTTSKRAWAQPLRNKTGPEVTQGMGKILNQIGEPKPSKIYSDRGKEWLNTDFQALMKKRKIHHYTTVSEGSKAAGVERFLRTIKSLLYKYMSTNQTDQWVQILPAALTNYNNRYHRTIKMRPKDVNKKTEKKALENQYGKKGDREAQLQKTYQKRSLFLQEGDFVRASKVKDIFRKGYIQQFSDQIFQIQKIHESFPLTYSIKSLETGNILPGKFYRSQLQKINLPQRGIKT